MASHLSTGADNIKKYWSRYYQGSQGVVFVLDSASSDEDLEAARNELHSALQHPQLCTLPFLILANHQDKPAARTPNQVTEPTHSSGVDLILFSFFLCLWVDTPKFFTVTSRLIWVITEIAMGLE